MSKQLARTVANGFNRQPAMLAPAYADVLIDSINALSSANAKEENEAADLARAEVLAAYGMSSSGDNKPFAFSNGLAFISISGLLVNRFAGSWGWVTGYNAIREQLNAALRDDDVKGIVFDVNSGGGQAAGAFELSEEIYNSRAIKPSIAVVDAASYSAAYALASAAGKIVATPSGGAGSIGVVSMHVDFSKSLAADGIKVTFIYSGEHKVDGNPYQALSPAVKADIQKSVDETRIEFVNLVARNRGLDSKVVYDTEAQVYSAKEAMQLGLIDEVAPPQEAVTSFFNVLSGTDSNGKETSMSKQETPGAESTAAAPEQEANVQTEAQAATPVAAQPDAKAAERQRIQGILSCEEAAERSALANHLALNTDLSVEAARQVLAAAAPEKKESAANPFTQAMDNGKNPEVGALAEGTDKGEETAAQRILKAQAVATGAQVH